MRVARLLAAALVAAVLVVLVPGPAWAHNSLTEAVPGRNATLDRAPAGVELTFLQKVDPAALTITVTDAGDREVPAGAAKADGKTGSIAFDEPPANGVYTVAYRVVSLDGHPVQGSYRFTVADPAAPSAPPSPVATPSALAARPAPAGAVPAADASEDSRWWWPPAGGALVLGALGVLLLRRRRTPR